MNRLRNAASPYRFGSNIGLRRRASGFVLLEVIVAMVILGISIATIMRSFTMSIAAIRDNDAVTRATILAQTALQSMEAEPPEKGSISGDFEMDGFPNYSYEVETEDEKIKYRLKTQTRIDDLRDLKTCRLTITYNNPNGRSSQVADAYLILPPLERFSYQSKLRNELFSEEDGI